MFGPQNWRLNRNRCSFLCFCVVNIRYNHLQSIDTENLELLPNLCAVFPKRRVVEEAVPCRRIDINFEPSYDQLITGLAIGEEGEKIEGGRGWKRKRKHWPVLLFFVALATWRTRSASTKKKKRNKFKPISRVDLRPMTMAADSRSDRCKEVRFRVVDGIFDVAARWKGTTPTDREWSALLVIRSSRFLHILFESFFVAVEQNIHIGIRQWREAKMADRVSKWRWPP